MVSVYLTDKCIAYENALSYFARIASWAKEFCPGFLAYHVQDVSDVSLDCDNIAMYMFNNPQDAMYFELKWK